MSLKSFFAVVSVILCLLPGRPAFAAPGDPDASFGPGNVGGSTSAPGGYSTIGCVVQADGKILVAGTVIAGLDARDIGVARYLPNGFLDYRFGFHGLATASAPNLNPLVIRLQPDGKILVLASEKYGAKKPWLIRFDTDGQLDPAFGSGGKASREHPESASWSPVAFDVQPSGKIVVLGIASGGCEILRFRPDGTLDSTFANKGVAPVSLTETGEGVAAFLLSLLDGRLLVAGHQGSDFAVRRFDAEGAPDASFPTGTKMANTRASTLILMPDGRFVVGGSIGEFGEDGMLARFEADGALDATFGSSGVLRVSLNESPYSSESITDVAVSAAGKIVVKGQDVNSSYRARVHPDGALDDSYGDNGVEASHFTDNYARGLLVLPDESVVAAGTPQGGFGLTKITADGDPDRTFAGSARILDHLGSWMYPAMEFEIKVLPGGSIYSGYTLPSSNHERRVFRYLPNGALDSSFGNEGVVVFPAAGAICFSNEGDIYLGGSSGTTATDGFSVRRFLPDGSADSAFGNSGEARAVFPDGPSYVRELLIGRDGKIVAIGDCESGTKVGMARFRVDGSLDGTFGSSGMAASLALVPYAKFAGALQDDGKILLAQSDGGGVILNRWNVDGTVDTAFGDGGVLTAQIGEVSRMIVRLAPGGKIVLAAHKYGQPVIIARYLATGAPDPEFGDEGVITTDPAWRASLQDLEVERDGKITLLAWSVGLARFNENGQLDSTFGAGGKSMADFDGWHYRAHAMALGPTGKIVVCGDVELPSPVQPFSFATYSFVAQFEGDTFRGPAQPQVSFEQIAGETVTGETSATQYAGFREGGTGAFGGWIQENGARVPVIFGPLGNVLIRKGTPLPQIGSGVAIARFREPQGGAVVANLQVGKGGVNVANAEVLLTGLNQGTLEVAARAGTVLTGLSGGVTIGKFLAVAQDGDQPVFLATLAGAGVTAANRVVLCIAPSPGEIRVLARTGWTWNGRVVRALTSLVPAAGSRAHNRWRAGDSILARLSFFGGGEAVVRIRLDATSAADWVAIFESGPDHGMPELAGATVKRFGFPDLSVDGTTVVQAVLTQDGKTAAAILQNAGEIRTVLARAGDAVPVDANGEPWLGVAARRLGDPTIGAGGQVAFHLTLSNGATGIGYVADGGDWTLLANTGANAPGGGAWSAFDSLVLPKEGTAGPVFTALLKKDAVAGVDATNRSGLWALTSWNSLERLLRSGDSFYGAAIRSFAALNPHSANATGFGIEMAVPVAARLASGQQVRLEITIP